MNKEKMGRDKMENGKKSKVTLDTMKPIVKEKPISLNVVIFCYWLYFIFNDYLTNNLIHFCFQCEPSEPVEKEIMLTGRAAEMAGYESSDEELDSYNSSSHRFSNPDQVKILLRSKNEN